MLGFGGLDVVRPIWKELIEALRMQLRIVAMIAEGETVAVRFIEMGQSVAPFRGHLATGRRTRSTRWNGSSSRPAESSGGGARDSAAISRQLRFGAA